MVRVEFLGSGPSKPIPREGCEKPSCEAARDGDEKTTRTQTSLLIEHKRKDLIINCTENVNKQFSRSDVDPYAVLITHGHRDAIGGLWKLRQYVEGDEKIPIYCTETTWERIEEEFSEIGHLEHNKIKPNESFPLMEIEITPIKLPHSRSPDKYPYTGFFFEASEGTIAFAADTSEIPSDERFKDSDVLIIDGAMWERKIYNHLAIKETLPVFDDWDNDVVIYTQIGVNVPPFNEAQEYIKDECKKCELSYDGMSFKLGELDETIELREKINEISDFDYSYFRNNENLSDEHKLLHSIFSDVKERDLVNEKPLIQCHTELVREYEFRDGEHEIEDELDELSKKCMKEDDVITRPKVLSCLSDSFKTDNRYVNLIGSLVDEGRSENDIDLLIRSNERDLKLEKRIWKMFPESLRDRLHFVYDPKGPHDNHIPLFDKKFIRSDFEEIEMSLPFGIEEPCKTDKWNPLEIIDNKNKLSEVFDFKKHNSFSIQKKFDGYRLMVDYTGDEPKFYTDSMREISQKIPEYLLKDVEEFEGELIDSELVARDDDGNHLPRTTLASLLNEDDVENAEMHLVVFDILSKDGNDITQNSLDERLEELRSYNNIGNIDILERGTQEYLCNDINEVKDSLIEVSDLDGSEGAMCKPIESVWNKDGENDSWIKIRKSHKINVVVYDKDSVEDSENHTFECGIPITEQQAKRFGDEYIKETGGRTLLKIGTTYISDIEVDEGDVIKVRVMEIREYDDGHYHWYIPIVIDKVNEVPSDLDEIDEIAFKAPRELQEKNEPDNVYPEDEGREINKEDFDKYWLGDVEANKPEFVLQEHRRGETLHMDLRLEYNKEVLYGFTLYEPGSIDQEPSIDDGEQVQGGIKPTEPHEWLDFQGVQEPGEPGSTEEYPGIFAIVAKGDYIKGYTREDFMEFFFKHEDGIPYSSEFIGEGEEKIPKKAAIDKFDDGRFVARKLDIDGEEKWLFWFTDDDKPYFEEDNVAPEDVIDRINELGLDDFLPDVYEPIIDDLEDKIEEGTKHTLDRGVEVCELEQSEDGVIISGIALKEGCYKGVRYDSDVLRECCGELEGVPIHINHIKDEDYGEVIRTWYDEDEKAICFEALITQDSIASLVTKESLGAVSIGAIVDTEEQEEDEPEVAVDINFKELSLASNPACKDCKIF